LREAIKILFGGKAEEVDSQTRQLEPLVSPQPMFVEYFIQKQDNDFLMLKELELIDTDIKELVLLNKNNLGDVDIDRLVQLQTLRTLRSLLEKA